MSSRKLVFRLNQRVRNWALSIVAVVVFVSLVAIYYFGMMLVRASLSDSSTWVALIPVVMIGIYAGIGINKARKTKDFKFYDDSVLVVGVGEFSYGYRYSVSSMVFVLSVPPGPPRMRVT